MEWYHFLASFFAGAFLANSVPHFTNGISGNRFPTPFAKPPGRGLSSPTTNVIWGLLNIVAGYLLYGAAPINREHWPLLIVSFAGIAIMSMLLAINFSKKDRI